MQANVPVVVVFTVIMASPVVVEDVPIPDHLPPPVTSSLGILQLGSQLVGGFAMGCHSGVEDIVMFHQLKFAKYENLDA